MRKSMDQHFQMLNIILLGKTGSGKSASGNTIVGKEKKTFEEGNSYESVTIICKAEHTEEDGQTINVIDTVGLYDTPVKFTNVQPKIEQIFDCTRHGLDVFLLVIRLGVRFTEEEKNAVQQIQKNFGAKFLKHRIVLFTHGDELHSPVEDYLKECEALRSVVDQSSGGFHVFNNKDGDRSQVTELLKKIESLRKMNGKKKYTERDFKETQDIILLKKCLLVAAVLEVIPAVTMLAIARMGELKKYAGKAALACAVPVVCAGLYFWMKKYTPRQK